MMSLKDVLLKDVHFPGHLLAQRAQSACNLLDCMESYELELSLGFCFIFFL